MRKQVGFFRFMGFFTWLSATAGVVWLIASIITNSVNFVGIWPIIRDIILIFVVGTIGCGLGDLFFSHACSLEEDKYCCK